MSIEQMKQDEDDLELIQNLKIRGKLEKKENSEAAGSEKGTEAAAEAEAAAENSGSDENPELKQEKQKPEDAKPAAPEGKKPGRYRKLILLAVAVLILVILILLIVSGVRNYQERKMMEAATAAYSDGETILPNVWIGDLKVSGMTGAEAEAALRELEEGKLLHTITVHLPDQDLVFTTELHDLNADLEAAVEEACCYGRDDGSLKALYEAVEASSEKEKRIPFDTAVTWDTDYIQKQLDSAAEKAYIEPVENVVDIDTTNGMITVTKGAPGQELDTAALMEQIDQAFAEADYEDIDFEYTVLPIEDVDLTHLYQKYTVEPVDAVYDAESASVTESSVGYAPDTAAWKARYEIEHAEKGDVITLKFHEVEPDMTTDELSSMLFRDTLYSYGSVYASNSARTENLRLACAAIDGTVIQPGEVFSFNSTVGERTTAKGYQSAIVYVSGESVSQTGGGICQVASTIYYCCLYAELEIVEREPHMFRVTYVPDGMDATVYWGSLDYKFRNNTDYPIKINAYLADGRCYIELIGTDVNHHNVELESVALTSLRYEVYRYVYDEDWNLLKKEDLGTSTYSAHNS